MVFYHYYDLYNGEINTKRSKVKDIWMTYLSFFFSLTFSLGVVSFGCWDFTSDYKTERKNFLKIY